MKQKLQLVMILFVMGAKSTFGQTAMLSPFAISSSGGFYTHPLGSFSATAGEMTMVETFHVNTFLTQGFQQPVPDTVINVGIGELNGAGLEIKIFPNPVINHLSVSIYADKIKMYRIRISDIIGQEISSSVYYPSAMGAAYDIDVSALSEGIYLLTLESADKKFIKTIQFVKNN
ncbi:MAG: T9SS type A sorting domain-containing protein [Bacteroidota bacterium]